MGGLSTESPTETGRQRCRRQHGDVYARRSVERIALSEWTAQGDLIYRKGIWELYMLVDEQDGNVLPLLGELVERGLDSGRLGLAVNDKEVLLVVRRRCDMLIAGKVSP